MKKTTPSGSLLAAHVKQPELTDTPGALKTPCGNYSRDPGKVPDNLDVGPGPALGDALLDAQQGIVAQFQDQHAAGAQIFCGVANEGGINRESVFAGKERDLRLVPADFNLQLRRFSEAECKADC